MESHTDVTAEMQSQTCTPPREYKLCLVGNISGGKTSLLMRFSKNQFEKEHSATVGAMFLDVQKVYTSISGSIPMRFNIWDTAGEERFRGLVPMYLRGSDAVIVVYDATKPNSIDELEYWVKEVRTRSSKNVAIVIAANKHDLPNKVNANQSKVHIFFCVKGLFVVEMNNYVGNVVFKSMHRFFACHCVMYVLEITSPW